MSRGAKRELSAINNACFELRRRYVPCPRDGIHALYQLTGEARNFNRRQPAPDRFAIASHHPALRQKPLKKASLHCNSRPMKELRKQNMLACRLAKRFATPMPVGIVRRVRLSIHAARAGKDTIGRKMKQPHRAIRA